MEHFYVTLPSDSSREYFPQNTIANYRTKLASPIHINPSEWEVGLVEISYPTCLSSSSPVNFLILEYDSIIFPVKHYESIDDIILTLQALMQKLDKRQEFVTSAVLCVKNFKLDKTFIPQLTSKQSTVVLNGKTVAFPTRMYHGVEDLFNTILNLERFNTDTPVTEERIYEPVYAYTDIIKPNLVGDSYVRLLTAIHYPSPEGYHRFDQPLYRPLEQSFIETISIQLVTKTGEDVKFAASSVPCITVLHFKKKHVSL